VRKSVQELEHFYATRLGAAARTMVARRLSTLWPSLAGQTVLGYGYALPWLQSYQQDAGRIIYAMPEEQGAARQTSPRGVCSVLSLDHDLPFEPGVFDRVLVVHGLEEAPRLGRLLEELWRVMKPEARIVIVAANRAGFWARSDKTPFGAGRPFSRAQLSGVLKDSGFVPLARSGALYCPPLNRLCGPGLAMGFEKFGELVLPGFSGLVLVEAVKRLYAGKRARQRKKLKQPKLAGVGVLGASSKAGRSWVKQNED